MTTADLDVRPSLRKLILIPALITLGVTLLRLAGELGGGPRTLFNRAAGGAGALVGIVWLIPIFGFYFGRKLAREDSRPAGAGRVFGFSGMALVVFVALVAAAFQFPIGSVAWIALMTAGSWIAVVIAHRGWPALSSALAAYGLAARVPVAVVMLFAILGDWQTHYDLPPPGFPEMGALAKWFSIGFVPQLTLWIGITVILGMLSGALALALSAAVPRPAAVR